jgi:hypothetical protein
MTAMTDGSEPFSRLSELRTTTDTVSTQLRRNATALHNDLLRREVEKKTRTPIDALEEKAMRETAALAAAAGTPEQAKAMLRKARGKLMSAAVNGADTATLEAMVRDFERLSKVAQEKRDAQQARERKKEEA